MMNVDEQQLRLAIAGAITILILLIGLVADVVILSTAGRWRRRLSVNMHRILAVELPSMDIVKYGLILSVSFVSGLTLIYTCSYFLPQFDKELLGIVIQSLTLHGMIIALTVFYLKKKEMNASLFFGIQRKKLLKDILSGGFFLVVSMPAILCFSMLYRMILYAFDIPLDLQDIMFQLTNADYTLVTRIFMLLLAVVIAPVAEEILFRGILFRWVSQRSGLVAGMIVSSVLFALIHMHVPSFGPIFMLAMALSFSYALSGSLLVPITMHAFFNLFGLIVFHIAQQ